MIPDTVFHVPLVGREKQEDAYAASAAYAGRDAPSRKHRICSITFRHDGVEWSASVGQRLPDIQVADPRARPKSDDWKDRSDPALVLADLAGVQFLVFTDCGENAGSHSAWVNPFMAGQPSGISYFSATEG